ncbi:hypothetical protein C8F04DRAFT_1244263 [Mycena alexandri]|uniref:Uncharacterized protein n=1 Tax=Mycena alexandri TaxID=1745969 RepID=A0AAD6RZQ0_9AGAR|nr:hypothetical protein C8F04DRAFT_1244263 [Mycena alexandri]
MILLASFEHPISPLPLAFWRCHPANNCKAYPQIPHALAQTQAHISRPSSANVSVEQFEELSTRMLFMQNRARATDAARVYKYKPEPEYMTFMTSMQVRMGGFDARGAVDDGGGGRMDWRVGEPRSTPIAPGVLKGWSWWRRQPWMGTTGWINVSSGGEIELIGAHLSQTQRALESLACIVAIADEGRGGGLQYMVHERALQTKRHQHEEHQEGKAEWWLWLFSFRGLIDPSQSASDESMADRERALNKGRAEGLGRVYFASPGFGRFHQQQAGRASTWCNYLCLFDPSTQVQTKFRGRSGFDSPCLLSGPEFYQRNPSAIHKGMSITMAGEGNQVFTHPPSLSLVEGWIARSASWIAKFYSPIDLHSHSRDRTWCMEHTLVLSRGSGMQEEIRGSTSHVRIHVRVTFSIQPASKANPPNFTELRA